MCNYWRWGKKEKSRFLRLSYTFIFFKNQKKKLYPGGAKTYKKEDSI